MVELKGFLWRDRALVQVKTSSLPCPLLYPCQLLSQSHSFAFSFVFPEHFGLLFFFIFKQSCLFIFETQTFHT